MFKIVAAALAILVATTVAVMLTVVADKGLLLC